MIRINQAAEIRISTMSNAKVQMSNQFQGSNEMPKQVRHDEGVILNSFQNPILNFDIHLTFARR